MCRRPTISLSSSKFREKLQIEGYRRFLADARLICAIGKGLPTQINLWGANKASNVQCVSWVRTSMVSEPRREKRIGIAHTTWNSLPITDSIDSCEINIVPIVTANTGDPIEVVVTQAVTRGLAPDNTMVTVRDQRDLVRRELTRSVGERTSSRRKNA